MNGFERRTQRKTERIVQAAFRLFSQFGFNKVSVNEIAEQAGVSPATIYNYFGTKEQLYAAALTRWMDGRLEQYELVLAADGDFAAKTKELLLLEARNVHTLVNELAKAPSSELASLERLMESYSESRIAPFFRKYVELGKCEGYIRAALSDEYMMRYFTMYTNELARLWAAPGGDGAELVDSLLETFFYGLVGRAPHN